MNDDFKGITGLIGIWLAWIAGNLEIIHQYAQLAATFAALFASGVYGVYYLIKIIRREK
jgi:hypothetical protein